MADIYARLTYDEYKALEMACKEFKETTHTSVAGYYYRAIRLPIGDLSMEFHGPIVKAAEGEIPNPDLQVS
ncbi:hypothetical protein LCGC14_1146680 [marine sediment metagenome]|uniref:Uncharacterized protein n=1 Tax=marine sediment metagenome TaxID=412755 RepID=A0A0F9Q2D1_9ZZZZ